MTRYASLVCDCTSFDYPSYPVSARPLFPSANPHVSPSTNLHFLPLFLTVPPLHLTHHKGMSFPTVAQHPRAENTP